MAYSQLTIIYKTYVITEAAYGFFRAESGYHENVTFATSYEEAIQWIDLLWDGKDPEGYFQKY